MRHRSTQPVASAKSPGSVATAMSGFSSDDEDWSGSVVGNNLISDLGHERNEEGGKRPAADQDGSSASERRGSVSSNGSVKTVGSLVSRKSSVPNRKLAHRSLLRVADETSEKHRYSPYTSSGPNHSTSASPTAPRQIAFLSAPQEQAPSSAPIDLQREITALQDHLKAFAQNLAAPSAVVTAYPQSTTDRQLHQLRQTITNLESRNKVLHMANDRLRNKNTELESGRSSMADELSRLTDEQELNSGSNERSRTCIGIDPGLIRDLAAALSTGDRSAPSIAEELFTLAESAMPYTGIEDVRREAFAPRERLRNVEGVLDVSLARMEMMEAKMKALSETARGANLSMWGGGAIKKDAMQLSSGEQGEPSSNEWSDWEQDTQTGKSSYAAGD